MTDASDINDIDIEEIDTSASAIPPEVRNALLSKADDLLEAERRFDEILKNGERQLAKEVDMMNRNLRSGMSEREALDAYKKATEAIAAETERLCKALEAEYENKYPAVS